MRFPTATTLALTTLWGAGCPNCFIASTRIATPAGPRPIVSLRPGDAVYAWSFAEDRAVVRKVLAVLSDTAPHVLAVRFGELLLAGVTQTHPIWDQHTSSWRPAGDLQGAVALAWVPGADARSAPYTDATRVDGQQQVYNLTVEGDENYFAEGILVHNKSPADTGFKDDASSEVGDCDVDTSARLDLADAREVFVATGNDAGDGLPDGLDQQVFTDEPSFAAYVSARGLALDPATVDFSTEAVVAVSYFASASCGTDLDGWAAWEGAPNHVEVRITDSSWTCDTACEMIGSVAVVLAVPAAGAPTACARVSGDSCE